MMKETCNARNPTCLDHDNLCNDFSESGSYFSEKQICEHHLRNILFEFLQFYLFF